MDPASRHKLMHISDLSEKLAQKHQLSLSSTAWSHLPMRNSQSTSQLNSHSLKNSHINRHMKSPSKPSLKISPESGFVGFFQKKNSHHYPIYVSMYLYHESLGESSLSHLRTSIRSTQRAGTCQRTHPLWSDAGPDWCHGLLLGRLGKVGILIWMMYIYI